MNFNFFILSVFSIVLANKNLQPNSPKISITSYAVVDLNSQIILAEKKIDLTVCTPIAQDLEIISLLQKSNNTEMINNIVNGKKNATNKALEFLQKNIHESCSENKLAKLNSIEDIIKILKKIKLKENKDEYINVYQNVIDNKMHSVFINKKTNLSIILIGTKNQIQNTAIIEILSNYIYRNYQNINIDSAKYLPSDYRIYKANKKYIKITQPQINLYLPNYIHNWKIKISWQKNNAPIKRNEQLGTITICSDQETLASYPIRSKEEAEKTNNIAIKIRDKMYKILNRIWRDE